MWETSSKNIINVALCILVSFPQISNMQVLYYKFVDTYNVSVQCYTVYVIRQFII